MKTFEVAIFATLTENELSWLQNQARNQGINYQIIIGNGNTSCNFEEEEVEERTIITPEMISAVTNSGVDMTALDVAEFCISNNIYTVQDALASDAVPSHIKEVLESYL